jgi:hypothetical protein
LQRQGEPALFQPGHGFVFGQGFHPLAAGSGIPHRASLAAWEYEDNKEF